MSDPAGCRLDGKTVVVTGGAGGIGQAIAARAIAAGATVSLWDRSAAALEATAASLDAGVATRIVDVTDAGSIAAALAADQAAFGRIDGLVNNAGILGQVAPIWEADADDFRRVVEVNLVGAFLCLRAVMGAMRQQSAAPFRGHIVNMASIQAKEGMPRAAAYSASKAGLIALTKSAGKDAAREAILVNAMTPAAVRTAMMDELTPERRAEILARIPMGRFVELDEIAAMALWLLSDACSFSTGAVFDLSGGRATY